MENQELKGISWVIHRAEKNIHKCLTFVTLSCLNFVSEIRNLEISPKVHTMSPLDSLAYIG